MRTLHVAVRLFTEYGVGATSYQMIAHAVGVTKGELDGEAMAWGVRAYSTRLKDLAAPLQTTEPTNV